MSGDTGNSGPGPDPSGGNPVRRAGWFWLALLTAAYFSAFALHPGLFFAVGVNHYPAWFLDTFALLASNDALTRGLDPYASNPLDYFHRAHVYSHWWLHLRDLGLTRADVLWLGLTLTGAFLLTALWRLRPQAPRQLLWYLAVLCSSPVLLAVDRGNNDLVIFLLLAPVVPGLLSARPHWRWLVPVLVVAAAMLKYYPAAAGLVLLAGADRRELWRRLLFTLLLLALAAWSMAGDFAKLGALAPHPSGLLSFGAPAVFNELGWNGRFPLLPGAVAGLAVAALSWRSRPLHEWSPRPAQRADGLHFILGAVLLTGCFFTSMNFGYRWIFAIWLAPLLWTLPQDTGTPDAVRRLAGHTRWLLLFVLWWGPLCCVLLNRLLGHVPAATIMRLASWFFLVEQPFDWAFFLCLLVFLTHFTRRRLAVLAPAPA